MTAIQETYYETEGNHLVELGDSIRVVLASFPDWDSWTSGIDDIEPGSVDVVLSPELITAPYHPEEIRENTSTICNRIIEAQVKSVRHPGTVFLLGTPEFSSMDNPTNSLLFIRDGLRVGRVDKSSLGAFELKHFSYPKGRSSAFLPGSDAVICLDAMSSVVRGSLSSDVRSLYVSSCWAVPAYPDDPTPHTRERYQSSLSKVVELAFDKYPTLLDVVVCDRTTEASGLESPLTAHFRRTDVE